METVSALGVLRGRLPANVPILFVPGNHEVGLRPRMNRMRTLVEQYRESWGEIHVLVDGAIEIGGRMFYGSPWTPPFHDWAFMKPEADLAKVFSGMPQGIDLLITHGPPRGILDPGYRTPYAGSLALLEAVSTRNVKHHVFGHLHGAGGQTVEMGDTQFYNVAACDEAYNLVHGCRVIEL